MQCRRCGHPRQSHDECGRCHTTTLTGWNEAERRFTGERICECKLYQGPLRNPYDCPHEVQTDGDDPNKCVHCGQIVAKKSAT